MPNPLHRSRLLFTVGFLLAFFGLLRVLLAQPAVPPTLSLNLFPLRLAGWRGRNLPLSSHVLHALRLHDYLNRIYVGSRGRALGLYVAYYPRQRFGDDIHSPKHCLPGSGWEPVLISSAAIPVAHAAPIRVNSYLVERGWQRDLVLYWYQGRGRVLRSELWGKWYQIWDGLLRHRSDEALVRIVSPVRGSAAHARARAIAFAGRVYPDLRAYIPN